MLMIDYLTWDSQFFERRIGRLAHPPLTPEGWYAVDQSARLQALDCVYLLLDIADTPAIVAAEAAGFNLVDVRYTLSREIPVNHLPAPRLPAGASLRQATPADSIALQAIARQVHTDTRFFSDSHFDPARSAEMYAVWIASYLEEVQFVSVWLAELLGETVGYLTCRITGELGRIGLVGLAPQARGLGLGTALLAAGIDWFAQQGASQVEVVTQGRNLPAQRLYQRGGFHSARLQLWFHKWYTSPDPE